METRYRSVLLPADLLREAESAGLDPAAVAARALKRAVDEHCRPDQDEPAAEAWSRSHVAGLRAYNDRMDREGPALAGLRRF